MEITTLKKVQCLQQYIIASCETVDPVLDMSLNKLLVREITRTQKLKKRLLNQLATFENNYSLSSSEFYKRYEKGEMGDDMDFVEWAATVEMVTNVEKRLTLLQTGSNP